MLKCNENFNGKDAYFTLNRFPPTFENRSKDSYDKWQFSADLYSSPSILQPSILRPPLIIRPLDLVPKGNFLC